jgi:hypothetical protein
LLLLVCALAEEGKLEGPLLRKDGDLAFRFAPIGGLLHPAGKPNLISVFLFITSRLKASGKPLTPQDGLLLTDALPQSPSWTCLFCFVWGGGNSGRWLAAL